MIKKGEEHYLWALIKAAKLPSVNRFERIVDVSSTISKIISEGRTPQYGTIEKILKKFPNVSRDWLETGNGKMLINPNLKPADEPTPPDAKSLPLITEDNVQEPEPRYGKKEIIALGKRVPTRLSPEAFAEAFPDWDGVPVYNTEVNASFITRYEDEGNKWEPLYYLRDPQFKECNFAARIAGDSMHSEIRHGDYIVCMEIEDKTDIIFGDIYYVITTGGLQTCKYINAYEVYNEDRTAKPRYDESKVMLVPKNDSISPTPLAKDRIARLYKVRGIIRGY